MGLFSKKSKKVSEQVNTPVEEVGLEVTESSQTDAIEVSPKESGPWDISEVDSEIKRIDLGAIKLPGVNGLQFRIEANAQTKQPVGVTVLSDGSAMTLSPFAAPKSGGLWDDERQEITESITSQGGSADDVPGLFGREIMARVPAKNADGKSGFMPLRFAGFEGNRWYLRISFSGKAAFDKEAASELEAILKDVVVDRGQEAKAPREVLPIVLPTQA